MKTHRTLSPQRDIFGLPPDKYSRVEVSVTQKGGTSWKMLGDVPWAIAGWLAFLTNHGVTLPRRVYTVCNIDLPVL